MKTISPAMANLIAKQLGNEPVNIIEIQWVINGQWHLYADKNITNYELPVDGVIQELGTLESVVKLDSQGQSNGIDIVLSDHKGNLKNIINNNDIHGRLVRVYQWFEGLPLSERFLLYEGEIASSITWKEGDRTLSFSAITQLNDKEVGFSPEEGNFPFLPNEAVGKAWPLIFGTVQNVPAVALFDVPVTNTIEDLTAADPSIQEQLDKLSTQLRDLEELSAYYILVLLIASAACDRGIEEYCPIEDQYQQLSDQTLFTIADLKAEQASIRAEQQTQKNLERNTISVVNGINFPQGTPVTVNIGNIQLSGTFSGNVFTISDRKVLTYSYNDGDDPFGFTFVRAGNIVNIKTESPLIYIVNIVPCTVNSIQAYIREENSDILTVVPTNWYEVKTTNIGSYTITYLELSLPLSSRDSRMQNNIYVNCTSTIGPNTVDIMEWLIETYTDLSFDTTSFNYVKNKINNYPSHFALLERKNIFQLLEDMAFQSRCAIWISKRTFYLRYLPEEQTEQDTITEDDIDAGSLELFTTNTEELVTRLTATWTDNYANTEKNTLILRHNIKKYGTREREIDFYIYNIAELVLKSATFWLIRFSNIWKNIRFQTYLHKMTLETFDIIKFDFTQNFVADTDVKGVITNLTYESNSQIINVEAWLPIKNGTMEIYIYALPSNIDITNLFPTTQEIAQGYAGGNGPGKNTEGDFAIPDNLRPLIQYTRIYEKEQKGERDQRQDYGDEEPSDLNDILPSLNFIGQGFGTGEPYVSQYNYGNYVGPTGEPIVSEERSAIYPGKVVSGSGDIYEVELYTKGLEKETNLVSVKQLQIESDSEETQIPDGTWVLVAANTVKKLGSETETEIEYTMQVPIWL